MDVTSGGIVLALKEGGALFVLLFFLVWFAKAFLKNVANTAVSVSQLNNDVLHELRETRKSVDQNTLAVLRMKDIIAKCTGGDHERTRDSHQDESEVSSD